METKNALGLLGSLINGPATSLGSVWADDGLGIQYQFDVYPLGTTVYGSNAIYVFARFDGRSYQPVYIGRAETLSTRLQGHERMNEAINLGASYLLVHKVPSKPKVEFTEAERRLIGFYSPALNTQHNRLTGDRGLLSALMNLNV